jgi:thioredoxin 1
LTHERQSITIDVSIGRRSLMVIEVTDQNFEDEVTKSALPVLVDLWAPWCRPCLMVAPVIDKLAGKYNGKVKFCRLNIDDNPQTAARYRIMSIPTLMFFKNGRVVDTVIGAVPERALQPKIEALL